MSVEIAYRQIDTKYDLVGQRVAELRVTAIFSCVLEIL